MGANLCVRHFEYSSKEVLEAKIRQVTDEDAYEDGHHYSGSWGVKHGSPIYERLNQPFDSVEDAEEFIADNNDKWEPLHAVPAYLDPGLPRNHKSEKLAALAKTLNELTHRAAYFNQQVVRADAAMLKSEFKSCEDCNSKINLKRFLTGHGSINCPVCGGKFLWKPVHETAKNRLDSDIVKTRNAIEEQRKKEMKKLKLERKLVWVVGGLCSS